MLEGLAAVGTKELAGFVFGQVLKLGQGALEDYTKDFFKDWMGEGVMLAERAFVQQRVGEAVGKFLQLIVEELDFRDVSPIDIRDHYEREIEQFIRNDQVKPILGRAFEKGCKAIDAEALAGIWQQSKFKQQPFPDMPDEFDWKGVADQYVREVRKIIKASPELRDVLQTETLEAIERSNEAIALSAEAIERNTTQLRGISPGFNINRYQESLQDCYCYLKLNTLDSTDQQYKLRLWRMFIPQNVREALPPWYSGD
ncbi:hypothetical protein NDA01_16895 [Trichocoleus desertorum AS-A10]|uniref:hypothetical protein n=1 Tax=Trichocoleus desertorum TaxID=1481672 RepID=UPI003296F420